MPARRMTCATARCPICRYDVWPRSQSESIIESSKCVRRHQVTKRCGSPLQPLPARNGITASVSPPCMSTMVPYWSNTRMVISRRRRPAMSASMVRISLVCVALVPVVRTTSASVGALPEVGQLRALSNDQGDHSKIKTCATNFGIISVTESDSAATGTRLASQTERTENRGHDEYERASAAGSVALAIDIRTGTGNAGTRRAQFGAGKSRRRENRRRLHPRRRRTTEPRAVASARQRRALSRKRGMGGPARQARMGGNQGAADGSLRRRETNSKVAPVYGDPHRGGAADNL